MAPTVEDPFYIPEFLRREVEERPVAKGPAKAEAPPAVPKKGVARGDKAKLRDLGYSDEQIAGMTRREAEYKVATKGKAPKES